MPRADGSVMDLMSMLNLPHTLHITSLPQRKG